MNSAAADGAIADAVGMAAVGLMWALSLAALAGLAFLMGKWLKNREERLKRPADPQQRRYNRKTLRSVKKGHRRSNNASDLDGYV